MTQTIEDAVSAVEQSVKEEEQRIEQAVAQSPFLGSMTMGIAAMWIDPVHIVAVLGISV